MLKLIMSIWNKEELPEEWIESILVPMYEKKSKPDFIDYICPSRLPIMYKLLSTVLLSRLTPYTEEIMWDHHCGFRRNRSNTDLILCISKILEKKWEYNERVHQFFIDFKKDYHSFRKKGLCNNLFGFCIPMILVILIKKCLNETYGRFRVGKHLSDMFLIRNGLKQGDVLSHRSST